MTVHVGSSMDEDAVWAAIDRQRLELSDLLQDLRDDEWARPSLCAGWTVRDIAAHLALAHAGRTRALSDLVRAGGSVDRMIRDMARRHATAPPEQLIAELRGMVGSRKLPPIVTHLEPLLDLLVHGQDITIPLGRPRPIPVEAAATAATRAWTMRWPLSRAFPVRDRLRGLHLVATDVAWSAGGGPRVEGPIGALLLVLTGRTASLEQLGGDGLGELLARIH